MIGIIIASIFAFACMFVYEHIKVYCCRNKVSVANPFFAIGFCSLLAVWTAVLVKFWNKGQTFGIGFGVRITAGILLTVAAAVLYAYILFFALPKDTYKKTDKDSSLVDTGVYNKCRHPGFYGFTFFALALAVLGGSKEGLIAGIAYSVLNLIYIVVQDVYYFPSYIEGYTDYKKKVPFLAFWR